MENIVWKLLEHGALEAFFINDAKEPALIITGGCYNPKAANPKTRYALFFGRGIDSEYFSSQKKAHDRALEFFAKPNFPFKLTWEKNGRKKELAAKQPKRSVI